VREGEDGRPAARDRVIEAHALTKRFGGRTAVAGVSFSVAAGETVGFLGPNGAGKTTTLRMLAGVFPPCAGTVRIGGDDVVRHSLRARARIGYLPERATLYGEMTVGALLRFVAAMRGQRGVALGRAVARVVDRMRLGELCHRRFETLSKGMRQRVALGAAIVGDPPVLLLDEPTAGLDPAERSEVRLLVRELAPAHAVLLSSHLLEDVATLCDRVVVLHRGRVIAADRPAALASRAGARVQVIVEVRAQRPAVLDVLGGISGIRLVTVEETEHATVRCRIASSAGTDVRPAVASAIVAAGLELLTLERREPSLEEIFLDLVEQRDGPA
jgi:ABC-2 type transport system ATP-binding protein